MKLNRVETLLMNNPVRAALQCHYEARLLMRLGGMMSGGEALEIGCGRGVGTAVILDRFGADSVFSFDLDPRMVERARRRLRDRLPSGRIRLDVGDCTSIDAPDSSFDAVFDFGIIHHVPVWQDAVREVARVLRPGGRFYFEEVTNIALRRWHYRTFLHHPRENRFSAEDFLAEVERAGIRVGGRWVSRWFGEFLIGVGELAPR